MTTIVHEAIALVSSPTPPSIAIRGGAGLQYAAVGELTNGERVTVLGTTLDSTGAEWLHIKRAGYDTVMTVTGYVLPKNGVVRTQSVASPDHERVVAENKKLTERIASQARQISYLAGEFWAEHTAYEKYRKAVAPLIDNLKSLLTLEEKQAS